MTAARRAAYLAAAFGLLAGLPAAAADFGLDLTNDSVLEGSSSATLRQSDRARAWLRLPLGGGASLRLSGFYEFSGTFSSSGADAVPWRLDLDRAELEGSLPAGASSRVAFSLGRIALGDRSGRVLSGLADGGRGELSIGNASFFLAAGYRGLLYKKDALSFLDADDAAAQADSGRYLAPSRAVAGAGFRLAEILPGQDAGLEAWGQADLEVSGTATHSVYLEPSAEGRLGRNFRWSAWGVLAAATGADAGKPAFAAGGLLRWTLPEAAGFRLAASARWASGDSSSVAAFLPASRSPAASVAPFAFSGVAAAGLSAGAAPLSGLDLSFSLDALFSTGAEVPADEGLRPGAAGPYVGSEAVLAASWRAASDLSLRASAGAFVPNASDVYEAGAAPRFKGELGLVLSL